MDPFTIGAIGTNVLGGLIGGQASAGDSKAALEAALAGQKAYQNIATPDIEKMKLELEKYVSAGQLTPEQAQAIALSGQDQLENVQLDPRLKQAQNDALAFLQQTGQTGLTPAERNQVNNLRRQTEADAQSRMEALLQNQDARGVGSSDMGLAARMIEAQSSANRMAQSTDDIAAQAFQRALQSMTQAGNMAGSMEQADYARQAQLAEAQRNRELANWQNQQSISNQNVQARNAAQQFNLNNAQNISNQNVNLNNQQQQYNKNLYQQDYENQMKKAAGLAGASGMASGAYQNRANETRDMWGNISKGVGGILAGNIGQKAATTQAGGDDLDFSTQENDPSKVTKFGSHLTK